MKSDILRNLTFRIKSMFKLFQLEPLWFKVLILLTLLTTIIFSSSAFSGNSRYEGISKSAAALLFAMYGYKLKLNRKVSMIFYGLAGLCFMLAFLAFINKH